MKALFLVSTMALLAPYIAATDDFQDCTEKKRSFWPFWSDQICCESKKLPNGCECFDKSSSPSIRLAECPKDLGVEFHLFTPENKRSSVIINSDDDSLVRSHYKAHLPTRFITHGFRDSGPAKWSEEMKDALLDESDMNVIIVNWQTGAGYPYRQASANVRSVGAVIAQLIHVMRNDHEAALWNIHLIGHSLGAHVSGMAGKEIKRLENVSVGRITGLDPAGYKFEDDDEKKSRLGPTDAHFVDVIHTNAEPILNGGFGIIRQVGNIDFYPNGGEHQSGCSDDNISLKILLRGDTKALSCSHSIVRDFFTNSIKKCNYMFVGANKQCPMGYHAKNFCRGVYKELTTKPNPPYC